jgi:methylated-DNA-[protein]-cysteine S-methyltransferase
LAPKELNQFNLKTPIQGLGLRVSYSLLGDEVLLDSIDLIWKRPFKAKSPDQLNTVEKRIARSLASYWTGHRDALEAIKLSPARGTPFQRQVWKAAQAIPTGATLSYGELARKIRRPHAARAVGQALNKNPWPLIVPCHRITASHHKLGGFALGAELKEILLSFEKNPFYRSLGRNL